MENLIKVQNELKVPKGNFNKFGNFKYRSAEDILECVKPILLKYNCIVILTDDIVVIGNKLFLVATARFIDNGVVTEVKGWAEMSEHKGMSSEQCTGTASSYARKYALNGLFLIDETEADVDNENVKPKEPQPIQQPQKETLSAERFIGMINSLKEGTVSFEKIKDKFAFSETQRAKLKELNYA